jgi:hypothetical protein
MKLLGKGLVLKVDHKLDNMNRLENFKESKKDEIKSIYLDKINHNIMKDFKD